MSADGVMNTRQPGDSIAWERRNVVATKRHRKKIARQLPPAGTTPLGRFRGENYTAIVVDAEGLPVGRLSSAIFSHR